MTKYIFILFFYFFFFNFSSASVKENIIKKFSSINNITFKFEQNINDKKEKGECIIKYSKKIFCSYNSRFNKVLVSNGKSLVIKSDKNRQYYIYPLDRTPLNLILDKNFILNIIKKEKITLIDNRYYNFKINNDKEIVNIFFDNKNYNLVGWQTEDIFQNLAITFIYEFKINQNIDENLFKLPKTH